jgi:hypothetical protein
VSPRPVELGPQNLRTEWKAELDRLLSTNVNRSARERLTLIRLFEELLGWATRVATTRFAGMRDVGADTCGCHSRMMFVRAYPRETQEMVFDAHDRAFAFFRGACTRGIYDNMKTAVETISIGKDRQYNRRKKTLLQTGKGPGDANRGASSFLRGFLRALSLTTLPDAGTGVKAPVQKTSGIWGAARAKNKPVHPNSNASNCCAPNVPSHDLLSISLRYPTPLARLAAIACGSAARSCPAAPAPGAAPAAARHPTAFGLTRRR